MFSRFMLPLCAGLLLSAAAFFGWAYAQTATSTSDTNAIQAQIDDRNNKIDELESQIAQLQKQLDQTSAQKQTLQTAITSLDLTRKKITAQIQLTQNQISQKDLEIQHLSGSIATTTNQIGVNTQTIAQSLRSLNETDKTPIQTFLFSGATLSNFFDQLMTLVQTREALRGKVTDLSSLKTNLVTSKANTEQKRAELASLKSTLASQQQSLSAAISSQNQLLAQTKNQESAYQALIGQKKAQEAQFEQELEDFQKQLKNTVDTSTLPHPGKGVLTWPLASVRITQYFGNTAFATANPQIYNGHGHSGIDLAASIGTPVMSAGDGVVMGSGNTDLTCPNASYGKWVLIKHDNGLATLYAHLSVINATAGEKVSTGTVIGYSGVTGYATGPHLHFGVFAADAVEIASFASKSCKGKVYTMPVAPLEGYLNPLSYL